MDDVHWLNQTDDARKAYLCCLFVLGLWFHVTVMFDWRVSNWRVRLNGTLFVCPLAYLGYLIGRTMRPEVKVN